MELEPTYAADGINIALTIVFIILNGFFVAAEFALVKVRKSQLNQMVKDNKPFAKTAMWIYKRQNMALSACQLGITMASLALGWIGEPAIAHLLTPLITKLGITSSNVIHGIAFTVAFSIITSLHIIIGEQVPKIYAIRKPNVVFTSSATILKGFYFMLYPFMYVLNGITNVILRWLGITDSDGHEGSLTEDEIKASLGIAFAKGELSQSEHSLLNAVFTFDDAVADKIMIPRGEVEFLDSEDSLSLNMVKARKSSHSRLPLCEGSLDKALGVVHIKDLFKYSNEEKIDLLSLARPPKYIPRNILISKLLHEFRVSRQHFAFIQDEHGTILGIVTLEDVLEELVGDLQDEFDFEEAQFLKQSDGTYVMDGDVLLDEINEAFNLSLTSESANTISGFIVEKFGHKLKKGKVFILDDLVEVELLEIEGIRVKKLKLKIPFQSDE